MGESGSFEDLEVWQRSKALAVEICIAFRDSRDFGFRDQITRSAISVPSNISEGAERPGRAEFRQFLGYAKGFGGRTSDAGFDCRGSSVLNGGSDEPNGR